MDIGITLTAFGAMMAGFFAIAKIMLTQASNDREADRKERDLLTRSINQMAKASDRVAVATNKGAEEAKTRNGHLGDQNLKLAELITGQAADISVIKETTQKNLQANTRVVTILSKSAVIAAEDRDILTTGPQLVQEQTVVHQTVKSKEQK
jgi:hypothetical protein